MLGLWLSYSSNNFHVFLIQGQMLGSTSILPQTKDGCSILLNASLSAEFNRMNLVWIRCYNSLYLSSIHFLKLDGFVWSLISRFGWNKVKLVTVVNDRAGRQWLVPNFGLSLCSSFDIGSIAHTSFPPIFLLKYFTSFWSSPSIVLNKRWTDATETGRKYQYHLHILGHKEPVLAESCRLQGNQAVWILLHQSPTEVLREGEVKGKSIISPGYEHRVKDSKLPSNFHLPSQEHVGDDTHRCIPIAFCYLHDEAFEGWFNLFRGWEEAYDFNERHGIGVFWVRWEAIVGATEGDFSEAYVGLQREKILEFSNV